MDVIIMNQSNNSMLSNFINDVKKIPVDRAVKKIQNGMPFEDFLKLPKRVMETHRCMRVAIDAYSIDQIKTLPLEVVSVVRDVDSIMGDDQWLALLSFHKDEEIFKFLSSLNMINNQKYTSIIKRLIDSNHEYSSILDKCEDLYPDILREYDKEGRLNVIASEIIAHSKVGVNVRKLLNEYPSLINYLPVEDQMNYIKENKDRLKALNDDNLKALIVADKDIYKVLDDNAKLNFINKNPEMFDILNNEQKLYLAALDINYFKRLDQTSQYLIVNNLGISEDIRSKIVINLLKNDPKNMKMINPKFSYFEEKYYMKVFDGIESKSNDEIVEKILHSKYTSAIGNLSETTLKVLFRKPLIDSYTEDQVGMFHRLSTIQMSKLIDIDSNYILPYLASASDKPRVLNNNEMIESEEKAKNLFAYMYGPEKYADYKEIIEKVFRLQESKNEILKKTFTDNDKTAHGMKDFNLVKSLEAVPLHYLKILFNKTIIEKCSLGQIEAYFESISNGNNGQEEFRNIIETAYGPRARAILESREQLDVHSINSLEIFDPRILDKYGEAFVHDCISYNIADFSEFLDIVKNPEKSELFFSYYSIIKEVHGDNVESMQKAISEYNYYDELLRNINDVELNDKQVMNLITVICSKANHFDINSLEELNDFDEIAKNKLEEELSVAKRVDFHGINQIVCLNLFGMDYANKNTAYQISVEQLLRLYDFSDAASIDSYSDEEKAIIKVFQLIKESNSENLTEFAKACSNTESIRNPIALHSVINKITQRQLDYFNSQLLTIESLERTCKSEEGKEDPLAYMEEMDGIKIYHLNGLPYFTIVHDSNLPFRELFTYEGQASSSALCTRIIGNGETGINKIGRDEINGAKDNYMIRYYFAPISSGIVAFHEHDAGTSHIRKEIIAHGTVQKMIEPRQLSENSTNEVAYYRRERDHSKINNKNNGGRILPMGMEVPATTFRDVKHQEKLTSICKQLEIPLIVVHTDKYVKKVKRENGKEGKVL